ncbi:MAG: GTPase, partial [Thermoanaerobaculia bacterium]
RPKIADYPFTTLIPFLGVVADEIGGEPFVVADLPGLIAGAAEGAGLGTQFLRHVERCRILVHLVDLSTAEESASEDLQTVERELEAFDRDLQHKESLIVGSKVDAVRPERRDELHRLAEKRGCTYLEISSVTGQGLRALIAELGRRLQQEKDA